MGVLLRADLTGHGHPSPSAKKGGMAMPCQVSTQKNIRAGFQFFFHNVLLHYQHHISKHWRPIFACHISGLLHSVSLPVISSIRICKTTITSIIFAFWCIQNYIAMSITKKESSRNSLASISLKYIYSYICHSLFINFCQFVKRLACL